MDKGGLLLRPKGAITGTTKSGTEWANILTQARRSISGFSASAEEGDAEQLTATRRAMAEAGLKTQRDGATLVCQRNDREVRITCSGGDLRV